MVAADDLAGRGDGVAGTVGVLDDLPPIAVDEHVMVRPAVKVQVLQ
jgi:hypothetical protein